MLPREYPVEWWFVVPPLLANVSALPGGNMYPLNFVFSVMLGIHWDHPRCQIEIKVSILADLQETVLQFVFHQNHLSGFVAVGGWSKFALSHGFHQTDGKTAKSVWKGKFRSHTAMKPSNQFWWNRTSELPPVDQPPCKISFRSDDVGGLGEYPAWLKRHKEQSNHFIFAHWAKEEIHKLHLFT